MKPIFSVHAGEYLVGTHIEENFKHLNVWLPSKDTGVDLLVTDKTNSRALALQVKFSKDFLGSLGNSSSEVVVAKVKAGGWWTFNQKKLSSSAADLWILVLYRFTKRDYDFIIIEPQELLKRYRQLGKDQERIQSYLWVTASNRCRGTRGLDKQQQDEVALDQYTSPIRDLSAYLNNWQTIEAKLSTGEHSRSCCLGSVRAVLWAERARALDRPSERILTRRPWVRRVDRSVTGRSNRRHRTAGAERLERIVGTWFCPD